MNMYIWSAVLIGLLLGLLCYKVYAFRIRPLLIRKLEGKIIKYFTNLYYHRKLWLKARWMGIKILQNPCDIFSLQEIIYETKPDLIVETGTGEGGTSMFFAMMLDQISPRGRVVTIDIKPKVYEASKFRIFEDKVVLIEGDSISQEVLEDVLKNISKGEKVMVTLDSLHTKEHVLKELRLYSKIVTVGQYLVVQDTILNSHPVYYSNDFHPLGHGPIEALEEFLKENSDFEVDHSREKFLLTFFPSGYLKRVK